MGGVRLAGGMTTHLLLDKAGCGTLHGMTDYTPTPQLLQAMAEYEAALAAVEEKREAAYAAMAADMKEYGLGNADMAQHVGMSEEGVRKAVRGRGVPRKAPGFRRGAYKGFPPRPVSGSTDAG